MNKKKLTEETVQWGRRSRGGAFWIRTPAVQKDERRAFVSRFNVTGI